ncbi:unnamed protein product [Effrenium voratum]|nr:unnamed protein product [Effrenium voratum]
MVNKKPRCPRSKWKWQKGKSLTQEEFWAALEEHAEHQHLMACCGNVKPFMKGRDKSEWKEKGLVRTHIYSILRVVSEKLDDGVPIKLIEVRNPWAWGEWNGDWCDTGSKSGESGKWLENPQLRERLLGTSGVDGAFFMSYEDFVKFFTAVSVCPLGSPEGHEPDEDVQEGSGDEDELEDLEEGPEAVGIMILGFIPGGPGSLTFSAVARADTALNMVLTNVAGVVLVPAMPLLCLSYLSTFTQKTTMRVNYWGLLESCIYVFVPVAAGVWARHKSPRIRSIIERYGTGICIFLIFTTFPAQIVEYVKMPGSLWRALPGVAMGNAFVSLMSNMAASWVGNRT